MGKNNTSKGGPGRGRLVFLLIVCVLVFAAFTARLVWMQFDQADVYAQKAADASTTGYTLTLPAARGTITDSHGTVLAYDETVFDLYLIYPSPPGADGQQTLKTLERLNLGGKDVETQLAAFALSVSAGAMPLARGLDADTVAALYAEGLPQSGAVRLVARGVRAWSDGTLLPHTLGFTGPITAEQWQANDYALRAAGVAMDADIGQSGLESVYDALLRGQAGQLAVRARIGSGELLSEVTATLPVAGANLQLYLNADLQRVVQNALQQQIYTLQTTKASGAGREARAGAAVVVDVRSGGILSAVSWPGYDLTTYRQDYAALLRESASPLLDRVLAGQYAPGSTFKPAVAASALAAGVITPYQTVSCTGRYYFYSGYHPRCLQISHSGPVNLFTALQHSCNIYFYDVGRRLGVDTFSATAQLLGLAAETGAELTSATGRLTWSADSNFQNGLELQAAIGQGNTAVTPLQLAAYAAALANDGARPALHFAEKATDPVTRAVVWQAQPQTLATAPGGSEVFGLIREGMVRMASSSGALRDAPVSCAAKTGSPQLAVRMANGSYYTNSVLIGYAPVDDPQIAVAIVLEYGGGGSNAAPVLRAVLDAWELWMQ